MKKSSASSIRCFLHAFHIISSFWMHWTNPGLLCVTPHLLRGFYDGGTGAFVNTGCWCHWNFLGMKLVLGRREKLEGKVKEMEGVNHQDHPVQNIYPPGGPRSPSIQPGKASESNRNSFRIRPDKFPNPTGKFPNTTVTFQVPKMEVLTYISWV